MTAKIKRTSFEFKPFSRKQRKILNWWTENSPVKDADGIIADGAIRSGKSLSMSLSFVLWAMTNFDGQIFAMCGKTVGSFRRNVLFWLKVMLKGRGYKLTEKISNNLCIISDGKRENYFYIFGGRDESSQDVIQGVTLAGIFLDEVVLMPQSFVNQATGRCSVEGSKMWFNCNPGSPSHWFKTDWIDKAKDKNILYLHFTMDDNLSLSEKIKERYRRTYIGIFFDRFILGLWVLAEGIIYPKYAEAIAEPPEDVKPEKHALSIDYGTQNAFAALIWAKYGDVWYAVDEYYYSGRDKGISKTDAEYGNDMDKFTENIEGRIPTIVDPSAASFITELKRKPTKKYRVVPADNAVMDGIREVSTAMERGLIKISPKLKNWKKEAGGYIWDNNPVEDRPVKTDDHLMDSMRYFVKTAKIAVPKRQIVQRKWWD